MQKKEILTRKFSRAFTGYDIAEVDFFLDELYREFSLMEHELDTLRARLASLEDAAQAAAEAPRPAVEGRGRTEIPAAPAYERLTPPAYEPAQAPACEPAALPLAVPPAEEDAMDAAAEPAQADAVAQAGFYFEQMYTQTAYLQREETYPEGTYPEGAYPEEETVFLVEAEETPGYGFMQEDAAQGPQEAE